MRKKIPGLTGKVDVLLSTTGFLPLFLLGGFRQFQGHSNMLELFWRFLRISSTFSALKMAKEPEKCFFPYFFRLIALSCLEV